MLLPPNATMAAPDVGARADEDNFDEGEERFGIVPGARGSAEEPDTPQSLVTLLRLLRVLFFKCWPPTLPKIVTFSMGSLNYLCQFEINEYKEILNATALSKSYEDMAAKIGV